jgi:outer membrane receptor protein involved in Fe transport
MAFLEGENKSYDDITENMLSPLKMLTIFGEYTHEVSDKFTFLVSGRYEYSMDYEKSLILPRFGVVFHLDDNSTIKALYGQAGRRPSGYEEYSSIYIDNNDNSIKKLLNFEKTNSCELLYLYRSKSILGNLSLFYNNLSNIIYEDTLPDGRTKVDMSYPYLFLNAPEDINIHNYGISFFLKYKISPKLEVRVGNVLSFITLETDNEYLTSAIKCDAPQNIVRFSVSYEFVEFFNFNLFGRVETSRKNINLEDLPAINI